MAVHKGYAYLNSWDDPNCEGGGTYVVDIRNPEGRQQVKFIPAQEPYYHGEGAHVVSDRRARASRATSWPSTTRPTART